MNKVKRKKKNVTIIIYVIDPHGKLENYTTCVCVGSYIMTLKSSEQV